MLKQYPVSLDMSTVNVSLWSVSYIHFMSVWGVPSIVFGRADYFGKNPRMCLCNPVCHILSKPVVELVGNGAMIFTDVKDKTELPQV